MLFRSGVLGLKAITELGLKVPSDIAVISFDDYEVFQLYSPPITALAQPIEAIADNLITILFNKLNSASKQKTSLSVTLSTQLIIRESSRMKK